ncbi:Alpha-crystallin domain-containing protein 22.3 [Capsicum chinense]|nr:Alpha-crystallin domain-containing protein 22.3 [Capsicum chinense]
MDITGALKEAIWLKGLFGELSKDLQITTVFCDSQSAIFLMKDQMVQEKTKHIDVRYHIHLSANLGAQSLVMEDELHPGCWGSFGGGSAIIKTSGVMTRSSFTTGHGLRKLYEERSKSLENSQPAMVSSSASPASEEWDNVISFTGSASLEKAGPLVGSVDVAESMDEYLFRVSLPGVTRDEKANVGLRFIRKSGVKLIPGSFGFVCVSDSGCDCGINRGRKSSLD